MAIETVPANRKLDTQAGRQSRIAAVLLVGLSALTAMARMARFPATGSLDLRLGLCEVLRGYASDLHEAEGAGH